jgi:hypothetical protein
MSEKQEAHEFFEENHKQIEENCLYSNQRFVF